jgi:hypothetical protein
MKCSICYENSSNIRFICSHIICLECITKCMNTLCPICRKDLSNEVPKKIKDIILNNNKITKIKNNSDIIDNLLNRLKNIDLLLHDNMIKQINNGEVISEYYLRDLINERAETIALNNYINNIK